MYSHVDMHIIFRLNVSLPLSLKMFEYLSLSYYIQCHACNEDYISYKISVIIIMACKQCFRLNVSLPLKAQLHGSAFGDFPDNAHPKYSQ